MQTTTVTEEQITGSKNELSSLSIKDLFFKYIRFLPIFILSLALALFGSYIYLRYSTPIYRSSATIMIKNDQNSGGVGDEKLNQLFQNEGTKNIQNEIEVLRSRTLMQRVVDSLQLNTNYYAVGKIKSPNIYKQGPFLLQIFELVDSSRAFSLTIRFINKDQFTVNNDKKHWNFGELFRTEYGVFRLLRNYNSAPGTEYNITWQPTIQTAAALAGGIQVTPRPGTEILIISLETTNPQMSADVINRLMIEYGEQTKEDKNREARQTLSFIDVRIDTLEKEIDLIEKRKLDYMIRNNLLAPESQTQNYLSNIIEADKVINEENLQMGVASMIDDYLSDKQNRYTTVPSTLGLNDPTLGGLIMEYNKAQISRKTLVDSKVPETNVLVKQNDQLIEKLRTNILESVKNIRSAIGLTINNFKRRSGIAEAQIKALPAKIKDVAEIQTQLDSKKGLYKFFLEQREEAAISVASTTPNSTIIEPAFASSVPVKPNRRTIQLMAILIGFGLPALFIFLLEIMNDKITTRYDIEKITQAAILGEVGHSYADTALVVGKTNRGMVAEQFRIIRSNLQYVLNKIEKPVILVTSSFSGEGKSFITTNLGAVLALAGKKTVILEFDIRKPKLLSGLGISKKPGITNYLLGKANIEDLFIPVPGYDNLFVIACGPVPPNPSELLLESKVDELFVYLKENFDTVLIDTAPVGMVSDAMTLGKYANCTMYIVRQGHTYKKQIGLVDEFYREGKLPKVSIVINDVKVKPGYGYYGYGRYGYGYGYNSSYYEEEHPPQTFLSRIFGLFNFNGKKVNKS